MADGRLRGYRAVVTGGSDGIGFGIAEAFAREGADLWLVARGRAKLEAARERLLPHGVPVNVTAAALAGPGAAEAVAGEVGSAWDGVDVLVHNAGVARFVAFDAVTAEDIQAQFNLNLLAPYLLTQYLLPRLAAARGSVIHISFTSSRRLIPGRPASVYAMTKGGVESLTRALALELGPRGVRVNAIAPGTIDTPLTRRMIESFSDERKAEYQKFVAEAFALGRLGEPGDVAAAAVYLASADAKWVTGSVLTVDGGLTTN